jgi:hypothetical protein
MVRPAAARMARNGASLPSLRARSSASPPDLPPAPPPPLAAAAHRRAASLPPAAYEVLGALPAHGVGARLSRTSWKDDSFYEITEAAIRQSGRGGAAWGVLTWRGARAGEAPTRIRGASKPLWRALGGGDAAAAATWPSLAAAALRSEAAAAAPAADEAAGGAEAPPADAAP